MTQPGRELKAKLTTLMCKHNVRPIARAPIPLRRRRRRGAWPPVRWRGFAGVL